MRRQNRFRARIADMEIIHVPNVLRLKVGRNPAQTAEMRIAEADRALDALEPLFIAWAAEGAMRIGAALCDIAPDQPVDRDRTDTIFGIAHDIRGVAGTFRYPILGEIADLLCALAMAKAVPERAQYDTAELTLAVALLRAMALVIEHRLSGDGGAEGGRLRRELRFLAAAIDEPAERAPRTLH